MRLRLISIFVPPGCDGRKVLTDVSTLGVAVLDILRASAESDCPEENFLETLLCRSDGALLIGPRSSGVDEVLVASKVRVFYSKEEIAYWLKHLPHVAKVPGKRGSMRRNMDRAYDVVCNSQAAIDRGVIAEALGISKSYASKLLTHLKEAKLVSRGPGCRWKKVGL